ncbi:MAG: hypothetical protein ACOVQK_08540, partial [Cyanobium sp.]
MTLPTPIDRGLARCRWALVLAGWSAVTWLAPAFSQVSLPTRFRPQAVEPLPGGMDSTPVLN